MRTRVKLLILLLLVAAIVAGATVNRDERSPERPATSGPEAGEEFADAGERDELGLVEPGVLTIGAAAPSELPFPTLALDEGMDFTEWYYDVEQAVLVPESSELAAGVTLADLREARLGAPAGPNHDAVLAAVQPTGETALYETPAEALAALREGEVDAVVIDYPTSLELLRGGGTGVVATGRLPAQGDLGFAFAATERSPLRACLSAAIANVRQQGFGLDRPCRSFSVA